MLITGTEVIKVRRSSFTEMHLLKMLLVMNHVFHIFRSKPTKSLSRMKR